MTADRLTLLRARLRREPRRRRQTSEPCCPECRAPMSRCPAIADPDGNSPCAKLAREPEPEPGGGEHPLPADRRLELRYHVSALARCPDCGVEPRMLCRTQSDVELGRPHAARVIAGAALWRRRQRA